MGNPYIFSSSHSYPIAPEIKRQIKCSLAKSFCTWLSLHEFGQIKVSGNLKDHHSFSSLGWRIYCEYSISTQTEQAIIYSTVYSPVHFTNSGPGATMNAVRFEPSVLVTCLFCRLVLYECCKEHWEMTLFRGGQFSGTFEQ